MDLSKQIIFSKESTNFEKEFPSLSKQTKFEKKSTNLSKQTNFEKEPTIFNKELINLDKQTNFEKSSSSKESINFGKGSQSIKQSFSKGSQSFGKGSINFGKGYNYHDNNIIEITEKNQQNKLSNLKIEYGDLIQMIKTEYVNYIGHQCNCCSITKRDNNKIYSGANGFAKILFDEIEDADIYCKRPKHKFDDYYSLYINQPGTISISGSKYKVINLFSQFTYGKTNSLGKLKILDYLKYHIEYAKKNNWIKNIDEFESPEQRIEWFKICLEKTALKVPSGSVIGIPWKIGCNLGGGDWNIYYDIIYKFAEKYKNLTIILVYNHDIIVNSCK